MLAVGNVCSPEQEISCLIIHEWEKSCSLQWCYVPSREVVLFLCSNLDDLVQR